MGQTWVYYSGFLHLLILFSSLSSFSSLPLLVDCSTAASYASSLFLIHILRLFSIPGHIVRNRHGDTYLGLTRIPENDNYDVFRFCLSLHSPSFHPHHIPSVTRLHLATSNRSLFHYITRRGRTRCPTSAELIVRSLGSLLRVQGAIRTLQRPN